MILQLSFDKSQIKDLKLLFRSMGLGKIEPQTQLAGDHFKN